MIRLLDKNVVDKIAAGEVIERPSSVVKELLENSIDSGARDITIEIKDGGLSFIRVTDNGCGIPKDEVRTAYMRHATSKIENEEDLTRISSLGFRGEALSTIAAVAQTEMITKTAEDMTGIKYVINGGEEVEYKEVGVPDGTTIVVRNLFFNTPARKKFLKTGMTEGSYINDLVLKIALSHPDIAFKLISNGSTKISTSGNGNIKDNIYQLFGKDITKNLLPISYDGDNIKLSGFIGKPFISRGNRGFENYFINNRYIKSSIINRAIEEGYRTFVMQHRFPFTVIYIELPKDKCDVNVHPTKMEFKYDNEKELFEVVSKSVRDALSEREIIPNIDHSVDRKNDKINSVVPESPYRPAEPFETRSNVSDGDKDKEITGTIGANSRIKGYTAGYNALNALKEASPDEPIYNMLKEDGVSYNPTGESDGKTGDVGQTSNNEYTSNDGQAPREGSSSYTGQATYNDKSSLAGQSAVTNANGNNNPQHNDTPANPYKAAANQNESCGAVLYNKQGKAEQLNLFEDNFLTMEARKKHRLIGQLFGTYWIIEYEDKLYIMDQHAAHEKVNYERLYKNLQDKRVLSQQLMPPMVVTVTYAERQAILDNYDLFMKIGYDIVEFGGNEFKINAVPSNLFGLHGREMFMEFVGSLINNAGYMSNDVFIKKLATMACKAAIKGNTTISFQEADALIDELLSLENPYTCPHGRPTIISMSKDELEKKFGRIV